MNTLGHYHCKCKPGYNGTHCEQDVDECKTSPCKNGATCTNTVGGFTCQCQQGFQGNLCDQGILFAFSMIICFYYSGLKNVDSIPVLALIDAGLFHSFKI